VIKLRRIRWVGHVECMEEMEMNLKNFIGKPEG
jgi:hypothetical protein